MSVSVVVVNGFPGTGKDTFVEYCVKHCPENLRIHKMSTVDIVVDAFKLCGWDGIKTPEVRAGMCDLKNIITNLFDTPFKLVAEKVNTLRVMQHVENDLELELYQDLLFVDCREPLEIERLCSCLKGIALLINRNPEEELSNEADSNVLDFNYHVIVDNSGTLEDLEQHAIKFINERMYLYESVFYNSDEDALQGSFEI
jgi:hypothetical protein